MASRAAHNAIKRTASVHALIRDSGATMVLDGWHCEMKADSGNHAGMENMKNEKQPSSAKSVNPRVVFVHIFFSFSVEPFLRVI